MDHKPSNPETNPWVDSRMASLDPAPEWKPDAGRALERLTQQKGSSPSQWMRLGMTATILATTAAILVLLPWQKLWTPEPATPPEATAAAVQEPTPPPAPQPQAEPAKPAEKPAPEAKPEAQKAPFDDVVYVDQLKDLPDNKEDLLKYLEALAAKRGLQDTRTPLDPLNQYYDIQVSRPAIVHQVLPKYPDAARQARITGVVELVITVNTDGSVRFESVKSGPGSGLEEAAREAVEQWRFTPGMKDGVPFAVTTVVTVNFTLR